MIQNNYRHFISELNCGYVKNQNTSHEMSITLFSDMILILKQKKNGYQLYRPPLPLESIILIDYESKRMFIYY